MNFCIFLLLPILGSIFFLLFVRNDYYFGDFERVLHPEYSRKNGEVTLETEDFTRQNEFFECSGLKCHGWLYLPNYDEFVEPKIINLYCHGFGAQKDHGPENIAIAMVSRERNLAAFIFDYRNFGGSDGTPRNLISPKLQIEDVHSAITHLRKSYPKSKLVLWGSSFGGGHVIVAGSQYYEKHKNEGDEEALLGIASLVPHMKGSSTFFQVASERGILFILKVLVGGLLDIALSKIGLGPVSVGILVEDDTRLGILKLSSKDFRVLMEKHAEFELGGWQNLTPARIAIQIGSYSPIEYAGDVKCPVLFIVAEKDTVCNVDFIKEAYEIVKMKNPKSQFYVVENVNHFEFFEKRTIEQYVPKGIEMIENFQKFE